MNSDDAKSIASRANRPVFPNDDQVVDYTVMDATQIRHACGDNAHAWATAFIMCVARRQFETGQPVVDHDAIKHWFANVIEAVKWKNMQDKQPGD